MNNYFKKLSVLFLLVILFLSGCSEVTSSYSGDTDSFNKSSSSYTYSDSYNFKSDYYINVDGDKVPSPTYEYDSGATAKCKDGTYSYSKHRRGTCSGHKGVAQWL